MSEYAFGLHSGHLNYRAARIAKRFGAWHVNFTEPGTGVRRGWFACANRGAPFDERTATKVLDAIEAAGGFDAMTHKADREPSNDW